MFAANDIDLDGDDGVNGGRKEDGCNHNAEVLGDEVRDGIRVLSRGEESKDVADNLHEQANGYCGEVPRSTPNEKEEMKCQSNDEESDPKDTQYQGGNISVKGVSAYPDRIGGGGAFLTRI